METNYSPPPPTPNTAPPTPTTPVGYVGDRVIDGTIAGLTTPISTADMVNVWTATKLANKGTVNTANGTLLLSH